MGADGGIPGWFFALFIVMILASIGTWLYRVSVARDLAERAGLDPDQAARVAMLGKDGVDAAYLASTLAQRSAPPPRAPYPPYVPPTPPRTTEERLRELQGLHDRGLISEDELQAQRAKILGSI